MKKLHHTSKQCEFPEAVCRKPPEDKAESDKSPLSAEHCQIRVPELITHVEWSMEKHSAEKAFRSLGAECLRLA